VYRHARHGNRLTSRLAARGKGDIQKRRGTPRVIKEKLVKVAHPVEEERVRMLALDAQILLHHRRVF
jgi:hypothetical protein